MRCDECGAEFDECGNCDSMVCDCDRDHDCNDGEEDGDDDDSDRAHDEIDW